MTKINSSLSGDIEDDYEKIVILSDTLIKKLYENKLKKEDRKLLVDAVNVIYAIRHNQE